MTTFSPFDRHQTIYSRYGSYLSFTWRQNSLLMQSMYNGLGSDNMALFTLTLVDADGKDIPYDLHIDVDHARMESERGHVILYITGQDMVRVHGVGVGLRLTRATADRQFDNTFSPDGDRWEVNAYDSQIKVGLRTLQGSLSVDAPWNRVHSDDIMADFTPDDDFVFEAEMTLFRSVWVPDAIRPSTIDEATKEAKASFEDWLAATIPVPDAWQQGRYFAAYINWSAMLNPHGNFKRPAMLMSKNWMNKVWSWDNCFNALALVEQDPDLAWDQVMLFFDHQDAQGAIPDHLTDATMSFRFCKPPIHGWTLRRLMAYPGVITDARLNDIYAPLCRWTEWWLTYRDDDGDGIPQYNHGNESGWDNGTVFGENVPVESPDLCGYLVFQMDVLAEVAEKLGKSDEAATWGQRADDLCERMIAHFWNDTQFVPKHANSHDVVAGDSSLVFMPLILGDRLPDHVREGLITNVKRFITPHGIASEHPDSPFYEADGYWRGPIWAPSTHLLVDGLLACGERDLALDICRRFCDMAQRSGMAENYDALNGDALRDRAYTWTASVFLLMGNLLWKAEQGQL